MSSAPSMSAPTHVQMYFVSEGMPVSTACSNTSHTYKAHNGTYEYSQVHANGHSSYTQYPGNGYASQPRRSDSLESLLSLNVLAAQLLDDYDDLASAQSVPHSPRRSAHRHTDSATLSERDSDSPVSNHVRYPSYSTVSSKAPSTPPADTQHASFHVYKASPSSPTSRQDVSNEYLLESAVPSMHHHASQEPRQTHYKHSNLPSELARGGISPSQNLTQPYTAPYGIKRSDTLPSRIESMVISEALAHETLSAGFGELEMKTSEDDHFRTPQAEVSDPLASTSILAEPFSLSPRNASPETSTSSNGSVAVASPKLEDSYRATPDLKGKGRSHEVEELPEAVGTYGSEAYGMQVEEVSNGVHLASTALPTASSSSLSPGRGRKISDWLKEQYEAKQRSGGNPSAAPSIVTGGRGAVLTNGGHQSSDKEVSSISSSISNGKKSGDAKYANGATSMDHGSTTSGRGRDASRSEAQSERARLLHTIIQNDFSAPEPTVHVPRNMLWHPTEYVGPPRRRSISSTSILNMVRPATSGSINESKPQAQRQASFDGLTSAGQKGAKADGLGRMKAFASSADDLLTRYRGSDQKPTMAFASHGRTASAGTTSHPGLARAFSIKRKAAPTPHVADYDYENNRPIVTGTPFEEMLDTSKLPPSSSSSASRPMNLHKRSFSSSLQNFLPTFSKGSTSKRKRNVSAPVEQLDLRVNGLADWRAENPLLPRDQSNPSPQNGSLPITGRQSPFSGWKYPGPKSSQSVDHNAALTPPTSHVHVTRTQLAVVSDPEIPVKSTLSEKRSFRNGSQKSSHRGGRAVSSASVMHDAVSEGEEPPSESDGEAEDEEEYNRIQSLASQQVARDSDYRARIVEKFKDSDRSSSSLGQYTVTTNGH